MQICFIYKVHYKIKREKKNTHPTLPPPRSAALRNN